MAPPSGRRADRLRRNPFVVIVVGFLLFLGVFEVLALGLAEGLGNGPVARLVAAVVVAPLAVLAYRLVITRFLEGRATAPEIDLDRRSVVLFGWGFVLATALMAIALLIVGLVGDVAFASGMPWWQALAASLGLAIASGVIEELFLRGVLFRVTEQHLGTWLGIAVSAVFFGFLHLANPDASVRTGVAIALEAGISLAAVFVLTRTLWAPIGVHIGWNLSESLAGIPVSGNEPSGVVSTTVDGPAWLTGGAFGLEASVVVVLLWLVVAAVALTLAIRRGRLVAPPWRRPTSGEDPD